MQIPEIPDLIHYAIPFFVATVILEIILTVKVKLKDYEFKDAGTSIIMGLGNVFISIFTKIMILAVFLFLYKFRFFTIPFVWWAWLILLFAEDFCYYWFHRISHESRLFWASHVVKHCFKTNLVWKFLYIYFLVSFNYNRFSSYNGFGTNEY